MNRFDQVLSIALLAAFLVCTSGCGTTTVGTPGSGGPSARLVLCEGWKDINGNGSPDPNEIVGEKYAFHMAEPITMVAFCKNMAGVEVYIGVLDLKNVPSPGPNGSAGGAVFNGAEQAFSYSPGYAIRSGNEALVTSVPAGTFYPGIRYYVSIRYQSGIVSKTAPGSKSLQIYR